MKKFLTILLFAGFIVVPVTSHAQSKLDQKQWAAGIGFSSIPAGISLKRYVSDSFSIEGVVGGWQPYGRHPDNDARGWGEGIAFDLGVVHEMPEIEEQPTFKLSWQYGAAGSIGIAGDPNGTAKIVGGMGNVGLQFTLKDFPIEFVAQYRPGLYLYQVAGVDDIQPEFIDFAAHIRVRF